MSSRLRAYLMMLSVVAIWGVAGPIIKYTLDYLDPVTFLTYRFFITSLFLVPILWLTSRHLFHQLHNLTPRQWFFFILSSIIGSTVQLGLLFWGFSLTSSFDGTLISSTAPLFVTIAGFLFLHEHITTREKLGIATAFIGSLIVIVEPVLKTGQLFSSSNLLGNFLILIATIAVAVHALLIKHNLRTNLSPFLMTTAMFVIGFISMSIISFITSSPSKIYDLLSNAPLSAHLGVLYMALFSGALAYWFYHKAQKTIEISEANLFHYLTPLFAAPLSFIWLKEPSSPFLFLGIAITVVGVCLAEIKTSKQ